MESEKPDNVLQNVANFTLPKPEISDPVSVSTFTHKDQKEQKPVKLRYDQNSGQKPSQEESIISITESHREIISEFDDSPNKISKTGHKSARKENDQHMNLENMIQMTSNQDRSYKTFRGLSHPTKFIVTPEPTEKSNDPGVNALVSQNIINEHSESYKTLNFTQRPSETQGELQSQSELDCSQNTAFISKTSKVLKYLTKNFEFDTSVQKNIRYLYL